MNTTKNRRTIKALATAGALALLLGACGGSDDADTGTPQAPATTEAATTETVEGGWTEEDEAAFQADYEQTQQHLVDNYGILNSAELCDSLHDGDTSVLADLAAEAGLPWDEDMHINDSGVTEAAYDWCAN